MKAYEVTYQKGTANLVCIYTCLDAARKHRKSVIATNGLGENLDPFDGSKARGKVKASAVKEISVDTD